MLACRRYTSISELSTLSSIAALHPVAFSSVLVGFSSLTEATGAHLGGPAVPPRPAALRGP